MSVDVHDSKRYVDLSKYFEKQQAYKDFEGFADPGPVDELCKKVIGNWDPDSDPEQGEVVRTMLYHAVYERADTYELPSEEEVRAMYEAFLSIVGVRWLLKETAE